MMMIPKNRKASFYIGMTCPGCGGELQLEDDFFVTSCPHCGSIFRIELPDLPPAYLIQSKVNKPEARFGINKYLKENNLPLTNSGLQLKQLYYPYWKIDAVLLRYRKKKYEAIVIEESRYNQEASYEREREEISLSPYMNTISAGNYFEGIPHTIGLRAEYIKMEPYSSDNIQEDFDTLPVLKQWEDIRKNILNTVETIDGIDLNEFGSNKTKIFYPKASIVYFPYFIFESYTNGGFHRYIVDGVSGRMVNHLSHLDDSDLVSPDSPQIKFGSLRVSAHRCPTCGEDLPAVKSFVYICHNCNTFISLEKNSLLEEQVFIAESSDNKDDKMFPFWAFKISETDSKYLKNMFGGIYSSDYLIIPAFKVPNFNAMYRLTKRISSAFPHLRLKNSEKWGHRFYWVNISLTDAMMYAEIFIQREKYAKAKREEEDITTFDPKEVKLFFAPFHSENYFYVDSVLNAITFEKNLIP